MPFTKGNKHRAKKVLSRPLDAQIIGFRGYEGQKEKLRNIPDWQERLRQYVDKLQSENDQDVAHNAIAHALSCPLNSPEITAGFDAIALSLNLSRSELIEQIGRGLLIVSRAEIPKLAQDETQVDTDFLAENSRKPNWGQSHAP